MIILISPAKSLDFESQVPVNDITALLFADKSDQLAKKMQKFSVAGLQALYGVSENIAKINKERFASWQTPIDSELGKSAIFAFTGDVYQGFQAQTLKKAQLNYAQKHLLILSGLYGALRPKDAILPYRLEMGTKLGINGCANLYDYWQSSVTELVNQQCAKEKQGQYVLNLASNEYFKVINKKQLMRPVVSPVFKDYKNGQYKMISFFAKKARGMMARFVIENKVKNLSDLCKFDVNGYYYVAEESSDDKPVFYRDAQIT